ncbi:Glycoside hydrolase family 17 protein [Dioscorea alata]|uniref:Glycoside hydrolase family 17 protein n=1 Tax=Dioscorea alata TaxID=55571 RepID=A0ACB7TY94_DIOAL|nr:Glycoside hydrolase family 17 protein [Dioscorea alata]
MISKLRLYSLDGALLRSLTSTDITIILDVPNSDLPTLTSSTSAASSWASSRNKEMFGVIVEEGIDEKYCRCRTMNPV